MKKTFLTGSLVGLFVMLFLVAVVSAEAPTITDAQTSPTTVYTNTDWELKLTITDPDEGNTLTGNVQFYVNDVATGTVQQQTALNNTETLISTLISSNFVKGDELVAEYWADDGTNTTAKVNTTAVNVQNSVPTISSGTITVDSHEDSDTATVSASDADSDPLTYSVVSGNASLVTCSIPTSGTTLTATRVGDETGTTTCTVTVDDGTATKSAVFTINIDRESMLEIYDLDVYVDDEKDSNLKDGDTISDKANPESTVKFDFVIKSLFDDNDEDEEDIEIEDIVIYVTIKNIDC